MREGERRWAVSSTIGESERASSTERGSSTRTKLFASRDHPFFFFFSSLFFIIIFIISRIFFLIPSLPPSVRVIVSFI